MGPKLGVVKKQSVSMLFLPHLVHPIVLIMRILDEEIYPYALNAVVE